MFYTCTVTTVHQDQLSPIRSARSSTRLTCGSLGGRSIKGHFLKEPVLEDVSLLVTKQQSLKSPGGWLEGVLTGAEVSRCWWDGTCAGSGSVWLSFIVNFYLIREQLFTLHTSKKLTEFCGPMNEWRKILSSQLASYYLVQFQNIYPPPPVSLLKTYIYCDLNWSPNFFEWYH